MSDLQKISDDIYHTIIMNEPFAKNKDLIVIGNNASGKTNFIKMLLKKAKSDGTDKIYYIDPMNRTINPNNNVTNEVFDNYTPIQILAYRTRTGIYTRKDVFAVDNPATDAATNGAELAYNELCTNLDDYNPIFIEFMEKELSKHRIGKITDNFKLIVNGDTSRDFASLSSSEVAIMRMLMEISYAQKCNCQYVIIDEFDAFLEIKNMLGFLRKLIATFPTLRFIVVIHNVEALVEIDDVDVFLIKASEVQKDIIWAELFDGNEVNKLAQLDRLLHRYSYRPPSEKEEILKNSINEFINKGTISASNKAYIETIEISNLSVRERVLYDYFIKGINNES